MVFEVDFKVSQFFEQNSLFRLDHFEQNTGSFENSEPKTLNYYKNARSTRFQLLPEIDWHNPSR